MSDKDLNKVYGMVFGILFFTISMPLVFITWELYRFNGREETRSTPSERPKSESTEKKHDGRRADAEVISIPLEIADSLRVHGDVVIFRGARYENHGGVVKRYAELPPNSPNQ